MARETRHHYKALLGEILLFLLLATQSVGQQFETPNLALGKPVEPSGPVWTGFTPAALTDGDSSTICHPLTDTSTLGYYFEIDLGNSFHLDRIRVRNRADGCCPERLSSYRVEVYAPDEGEAGALNWSALIREDGSNSGVSGVDEISGTLDEEGKFEGRFIRIINNNNAPYSPQVAEVEVYGKPPPKIIFFRADDDTVNSGTPVVLQWEIAGATEASIEPEIGTIHPQKGTLTFTPAGTGIYTLTARSQSGTSSQSIAIGVDVTMIPPVITEFLADNAGGLKDQDGDTADWIELKNPNPYHLELNGYSLADNPNSPVRWPFPATRIPPNQYIIIFASGKDRRPSSGEMHTHFRLNDDGDYLALYHKEGQVLQQYPANYPATPVYPAQLKNISYGIGNNGQTGYLPKPTPSQENGPSYPGVVGKIQISPDRGFYDQAISVSLTCPTPGTVIRYTTDRTEPTATRGTVYSGPIFISRTAVLRARAFRTGWAPSDISTHTYIFPTDIINSPVMNTAITKHPTYSTQIRAGLTDIPSLSINTAGAVQDTALVKSSVEWLELGKPGFQVDCGTKYFGGAFTDFSKKNFRLYFRDEYGASKLEFPIFAGFDRGIAPVESFDQLELRGGSHDMNQRGFYMSNIFTDDTLLEMGQLNPHGRFAHLYLNGVYHGLYHLRERWNAAMHESYLGGAKTNYESINGNWNVGGWAEPGTPYDGDGSAWARIKSLRDNYKGIKPYLDVPQYIEYMLMWMFGGAEDEYRCVGPTVPGSGFKFYLNDADGWFCGPYYCDAGDRTRRGAPGRSAGDGPGSIFSMLFKEGDPDYKVLLADHIYQALLENGPLTSEHSKARLVRRCNEITRAFIAESARWNFLTPVEWSSRRNDALNNWLPRRPEEALQQFRRAGFYPSLEAPVIQPEGGIVSAGYKLKFEMIDRGTILYTLDGSDPRLPGGAISSKALAYSPTGSSQVLIPAGSTWKWFTDGVGLGSSAIMVGHAEWGSGNWKNPAFNDAGWKEGRAQFGYGEGDEATVLPYGPDPNQKWPTIYFRHHFTLNALAQITSANLRVKRDDGVLIYLNGREVARSSISTGPVIGSTYADPAPDDGQSFHLFSVPIGFLIEGENVLCVEVHQAVGNSSDVSFDLECSVLKTDSGPTDSLPIIAKNTIVRARVKDGGEWSALNEAYIQTEATRVAAGEIVIGEINPGIGNSSPEFLELWNVSSRAINLRGCRFSEGIQFNFPTQRDTILAPGERLVLVKDLFRFQQAFGLSPKVAGIYFGSINDEGERISLLGSASEVLFRFNLQLGNSWPTAAMESGRSLVLAHPGYGMDNRLAWRPSAEAGGSPGSTDSTFFSGNGAADEDNDGIPSLMEYAMGTSDTNAQSGQGLLFPEMNDNGFFAATVQRSLRADDILLQVEASTDLERWFAAVLLFTQAATDGTAHERWGAHTANERALFLRVRAEQIARPE